MEKWAAPGAELMNPLTSITRNYLFAAVLLYFFDGSITRNFLSRKLKVGLKICFAHFAVKIEIENRPKMVELKLISQNCQKLRF